VHGLSARQTDHHRSRWSVDTALTETLNVHTAPARIFRAVPQDTSAISEAARMIYRASRYDRVSSLLKELHWLRVPERIEFKLCALVYKCLNGNGPAYLSDSLQRVTDVQSRRRLQGRSDGGISGYIPQNQPK